MGVRMTGLLGAVFGFLAVALGAYAAHGLRGSLSPGELATFETGVRYQMYHALALTAFSELTTATHADLIVVSGLPVQYFERDKGTLRDLLLVAALSRPAPPAWARTAASAFTLGITIFSGSLYLMVLAQLRWMGAITPIGGVAFLVGWSALAWGFFRRES